MDKKTHQMKLAYWTGIIKESKSSGMKVSEWCLENQISIRRYYYWHKKVMHSAYDAAVENRLLPAPDRDSFSMDQLKVPEFAELSLPDKSTTRKQVNDPGIKIIFNDFTISVDEGFSERELARVLQVMNHV